MHAVYNIGAKVSGNIKIYDFCKGKPSPERQKNAY
jgi:hypothetical protein